MQSRWREATCPTEAELGFSKLDQISRFKPSAGVPHKINVGILLHQKFKEGWVEYLLNRCDMIAQWFTQRLCSEPLGDGIESSEKWGKCWIWMPSGFFYQCPFSDQSRSIFSSVPNPPPPHPSGVPPRYSTALAWRWPMPRLVLKTLQKPGLEWAWWGKQTHGCEIINLYVKLWNRQLRFAEKKLRYAEKSCDL